MDQNLKKRKLDNENENEFNKINEKKPKREPFQTITNVDIEHKRHNVEHLVKKNSISKIENNESKSTHEPNTITINEQTTQQILASTFHSKRSYYASIESDSGLSSTNDISTLSPIKQIVTKVVESIKTKIDHEILEQVTEEGEVNELDENNGFESLKTSTPAKLFSNNYDEIDQDLLLICKENNITVENSSKFVLNEIDSNPVPQCFYSSSQNENEKTSKQKKQKYKIKFNFKPKISNTLENTSLPTTSKQSAPRKPRQPFPNNDKIDFAIGKVLELFTADEIRTGVFGDEQSKTRSKTRVPLDQAKSLGIKNSVGEKFQLEGEDLNKLWLNIRSKLNIRLKDLPKTVKFQKKFETKIENNQN